jgi:hypothetical protein
VGSEPGECCIEGGEQLRAAREEADAQQVVDRLGQLFAVGVAGIGDALGGANQQPVREDDLAIAVEEVVRAGDRSSERSGRIRIRRSCLIEQLRNLRQVAVDARPDVGGLSQAGALLLAGDAQLRASQQRIDGRDRIPASETVMRLLLEQGCDVLIWGGRRFGQVPCTDSTATSTGCLVRDTTVAGIGDRRRTRSTHRSGMTGRLARGRLR